ncbi:unannotated protein [freshwater metagenome]|uniref:Unannotated protein n=1 Tax=freshwater metagenome TaxID=449393 RepID=A0A6J6VM50_9ZZZZ
MVARHQNERPNIDAHCVERHDHHGKTLVLGQRRIGAQHAHTERGVVGGGGPHLLPVDDELVTVAHCSGGEPGHIAARAGLAEHLAPDLFALQHARHVGEPLRLGTVFEQDRYAHADGDRVEPGGQPVLDRLLVEDLEVVVGEPRSAVNPGHGESGKSGIEQPRLEVDAHFARDVRRDLAEIDALGRVGCEERGRIRTKCNVIGWCGHRRTRCHVVHREPLGRGGAVVPFTWAPYHSTHHSWIGVSTARRM